MKAVSAQVYSRTTLKIMQYSGGSPGLVVMVMFQSSNPSTVYWMDIFSHLFVLKFVMLFEKTKINEKEAGVSPFFKKRNMTALAWHLFTFLTAGLIV